MSSISNNFPNYTLIEGIYITNTFGDNDQIKSSIEWLLTGDPSIRWQVHQYLLQSDKDVIHNARLLVELEGWGANFLEILRRNEFNISNLFEPKWKGLIWVLNTLKQLGIYPLDQLKSPSRQLLEFGLTHSGGISVRGDEDKRGEECYSGITLGILSYFGINDPRREAIIEFFIENQMSDGGWNCEFPNGATHSSFNTTLLVLRGLRDYNLVNRKNEALVKDMQKEAHEFLLNHKLFKSHTTDAIVDLKYTKFAFPPRQHYDILSALDYFQSINFKFDERLEEPFNYMYTKGIDMKWVQETNPESGEEWIEIEESTKLSRWNTLRSLKVLKWWEGITSKMYIE